MDKVGSVAALLLALTSSASGFDVVVGALFPFFLSYGLPQVLPFDVTQNRIGIHAEEGSVIFPDNPNAYYEQQEIKRRSPFDNAAVSGYNQRIKDKDEFRPTPTYGYEIDQEQIQHGNYQTANSAATSQKRPQYSESNQAQYQQGQSIQYGAIAQNIPVNYAGTAKPGQGSYQALSAAIAQKRPAQYSEGDQDQYQQGQSAQYGATAQNIPNYQASPSAAIGQKRPAQYSESNQAQNQQYGEVAQKQVGQTIRPSSQNHQNSQLEQNNQNNGNGAFMGLIAPPLKGIDTSDSQSNAASDPQIPVQQADLMPTSVTGFGLAIMKALQSVHSGNSVVSPYSIALVLALLQQGTDGESQAQITRALRMAAPQSRQYFRALSTAIKNRRSSNILKIATNIFFGEPFVVARQYKTDAINYFGSDLVLTDFTNANVAAKQINDWISAGTQGRIPYLVSADAFSGDTQLFLANAVFFKGLWNATFSPQRTVTRPFNLAGGDTKPASFMHQSGRFQSGKDPKLDVEFLLLPFEGFQFTLILMVPSVSTGVDSLLQRIEPEDILAYLRSPQREVIISLPKFRVRIDTDLFGPLNSLGIQDIFTYRSGLVGLGTTRGDRPRVTGALHTAVLSIDEQGGSAAASTILAISTLSLDSYDQEFRFQADRPFVAILWDSQLNVPLFIAKIADPTLEN